ncbi:unnamed protein product [Owenia fusiformis]|uniref:Uncharacterized protein n=1 Tax=Owenia fusiformis TaxID=6347 RepID=A0A8J1U037_OWEFU|nr:unnamed protein product [Owenia fusiformis]
MADKDTTGEHSYSKRATDDQRKTKESPPRIDTTPKTTANIIPQATPTFQIQPQWGQVYQPMQNWQMPNWYSPYQKWTMGPPQMTNFTPTMFPNLSFNNPISSTSPSASQGAPPINTTQTATQSTSTASTNMTNQQHLNPSNNWPNISNAPQAIPNIGQIGGQNFPPNIIPPPQNPGMFCLNAVPNADMIGSIINSSLRDKIWSNEFVELHKLIQDDLENENEGFEVTIKQGNQIIIPTKKGKKFLSYPDWSKAMYTYISIYILKYPQTAPALMSYMANILEMKNRGMNWGQYDRSFRQARANTLAPWDVIDGAKWLKATPYYKVNVDKSDQDNLKRSDRSDNTIEPFIPNGFCWKFHKGKKCEKGDSCVGHHYCPACGEGEVHRAINCNEAKANPFRGKGKGKFQYSRKRKN